MFNLFIPMLKQQALGVVNFTLFFLIIAYFYPAVFTTIAGKFICSLIVGIYVAYFCYKVAKATNASLLFGPSGECKEQFDALIKSCGMDPNNVVVRYSYTQERVGQAQLNTMSIDPLLFDAFDHDPQAQMVKNILEQHIVPTFSAYQKERMAKVKNIFTQPAQWFIVHHELAHILNNYSIKKITITGCIATVASYSGISTAVALHQAWGALAIVAGMVAGGLLDLLLSYATNVLFTAQAEKNADLFAVHHCSAETVRAAADFFEKHQEIMDHDQDPASMLRILPSIILSGHPHGSVRARYLRDAVSGK